MNTNRDAAKEPKRAVFIWTSAPDRDRTDCHRAMSASAAARTFNPKSKVSSFGFFLENKNALLKGIAKHGSVTKMTPEESVLSKLAAPAESKAVLAKPGLGVSSLKLSSGNSKEVSLEQMILCGMHLGHATFKWSQKMAPYIYGERAGIHIIDLEKTFVCLRQACHVLTDVASKGGSILFVGTGKNIQRLTYECAEDCGQFYVNLRWIGGTITNRASVLRNDSILPTVLVVLDPIANHKAILEANQSSIPVIAICDTDCDPSLITYPIPANDDAFASVELIARTLSMAAKRGREQMEKTKSNKIIQSATEFIDSVFRNERRY